MVYWGIESIRKLVSPDEVTDDVFYSWLVMTDIVQKDASVEH